MKYLFLCQSLNVGGLETYILRFAKWLSRNHPNDKLELICKSGEYGPYESEFRAAGITLHAKPLGYFNPVPYFHLYRFLQINRYVAICDFGGDFSAFTMLLSYLTKCSKRVTFYRSSRNSYKSTVYKRFYQYLLNHLVRLFSTRILSNSKAAFDYFFNPSVSVDSRFEVIRNAIPIINPLSTLQIDSLRQGLGIMDTQKVVLHVGSSRWEKNHACMLEIARLCSIDFENVVFLFVGSDVEMAHGSCVKKLGLKNVRFLGQRTDVAGLLQIADIFLFPSHTEGQPNALLEAMIAGLPFIAANIGPIRESLPSDWSERWLFDPDEPDQGYSLLQKHIKNDFKKDQQFRALVAWSKESFDEDSCFGRFRDVLKN